MAASRGALRRARAAAAMATTTPTPPPPPTTTRRSGASAAADAADADAWLEEQERAVAPRVLRTLENEEAHLTSDGGSDHGDVGGSSSSSTRNSGGGVTVSHRLDGVGAASLEATPEAYREVLELLREAEKRWPPTNPNRAKLIGDGSGDGGSGGGSSSSSSSNRRDAKEEQREKERMQW